MMDQTAKLISIFDEFKRKLERCPAGKKATVVQKAIGYLETLLKSLQPSQKEIKQKLLTNPEAMRIREIWNLHKRLFDLVGMARELGLEVKRPNIDHIITAYYVPENRLDELVHKLEKVVQNDPAIMEQREFQEWRGSLRSESSQDAIKVRLEQLLRTRGVGSLKKFAEHLNTKDVSGNKKLPKNAPEARVVEALAINIWREKMRSKAQEGT